MLNEASPESARPVIRPCRPSVHPSRGGERRGGEGTDEGTDTCALGTGHTLVYTYIKTSMFEISFLLMVGSSSTRKKRNKQTKNFQIFVPFIYYVYAWVTNTKKENITF